ncbi:putative PurR-regulated permease PerM [Angulomicrobium tetraedrale]|uniref:Putative PurR-regulated permease PerM n=1 Tax=Ancylobacter tetraedralis TaxID=217068 RepID=A0A839Z732_9HYPH|nr:AI-2E family transporter [Ancylobacter tetraedralis]MBB3770430.1 putative PurR-regulated permease PerM [Ancylobacter tetraedralis]
MKRHIVSAAEPRQGGARQIGTRGGPGDLPPEEKRGERLWRRATQVAIIVTAVIVLAAAMVVARAVLVPIVAAVIIGSVIGPAMEAMARRGVPTPLGSALIVAMLGGLLYGAAVILAAPLADWTARAPEIGAIVQDRFAALKPALHTVSSFVETIESIGRAAEPPMTVRLADSRMLESALGLVTPAIGELILFTGSLVFFLAGRIQIKRRLVQAIGPRSTRLAALRVFREIEDRLGAYLVTATFINIGLGVATTLITWALGLPSPLLWGALAGLLNYIPYLGPAVMALILAVAGIVSFPGIVQALLPAAAFVALTSIEGHVLTPLIISRRVSLNPFAVFLSMALWTWLWGPAGTFLAVPLLIAAMALADGVIARRRPDLPG